MLRRPLVLIVVALLLLVVAATAAVSVSGDEPSAAVTERELVVESDPAAGPATLEAELFLPASTPAPAVLLAHGFGGSVDSVAEQARDLAADGFVVLAYSARGFGASTGQIGINAPDGEVADGAALLDVLADTPEVTQDGPGDPRVGVAGASYGGALALSLAGTDDRVDAVAAAITWNDLGQALLPDRASERAPTADTPAAGATGSDGVLKRDWAGIFFGAGASADGVCGRFTEPVCRLYLAAAVSGQPTDELLDLLRAHSPTATNGAVTAPVLLLQGEQDTLFGLEQSDANARELTGASVRTRWFAGGHDAGGTGADADAQVAAFLTDQLTDGAGPEPAGFAYEVPGPVSTQGTRTSRTVGLDGYPGLGSAATPLRALALSDGDAQPVARPPGASPAAISTVPGLGSALGDLAAGLSGAATLDVPGQVASFATAPLATAMTVTGSSRVELQVSGLDGGGEAVLFAKLYDVAPDGTRTLPGGGVAAFRLTDLPTDGSPTTVTVTLPGVVADVAAGHHLEVAVSTTDRAYAVPLTPAAYVVAAVGDLQVPAVGGTALAAGSSVPVLPAVGIGVLVVGAAAALLLGRVRRGRAAEPDATLSDTPLVVRGLAKSYADGFRAVDGVDFRVQPGQVLGLLGPNGAGKTTTLRMLMGLITPTEGEIRVFGHRITPGAPVLSRLGSFVEGSGFLPHLSGSANLELYWAATGRPPEHAHLAEALEIAGLGTAVQRKVGSYSQGMRQRLAIAQAMLGLPDLLVLDEPTNGLDPPQIRAMRAVLRDYAATGRTVLVSSHLLSEVEQTCSHVVVMNKGTVVAAGPVADIVAADGQVVLRVSEPERAVAVLGALDGVGELSVEDGTGVVQADLGSVPPAAAVRTLVDAGLQVSSVAQRNRLEDVFLALVEAPPAEKSTAKETTR